MTATEDERGRLSDVRHRGVGQAASLNGDSELIKRIIYKKKKVISRMTTGIRTLPTLKKMVSRTSRLWRSQCRS